MIFHPLKIQGAWLIEPQFHQDDRGRFRRTFCPQALAAQGIHFEVKQCNLSENPRKHTLRGFHWQAGGEQKIITCVRGVAHDIIVDLRRDSPTYCQWQGLELNATHGISLYIPPGCANAWMTLENETIFHYWHSDFYRPEAECGLRYNDPFFSFLWPTEPEVISDKDRAYPNYKS